MAEVPITCKFFDPSAEGVKEGRLLSEDFPFNRPLSYDSCRCAALLDGAPVGPCSIKESQPSCPYYEPTPEVTLFSTGEYDIVLTRTEQGTGYFEVIRASDRSVVAAAPEEETALLLAANELDEEITTFRPPVEEHSSYLASLL